MQNKSYFEHIDGLRAVAVFLVIFFHLQYSLFPGGFIGVDVFFVISGFLITKQIYDEYEKTGQFRLGLFLKKRFWRIFPALIVILILSIIFAFLLFAPVHLKGTGYGISSAFFGVSNIFFWAQSGYFEHGAYVRPALHTWSLSVEAQFYVAWAIGLALLGRFFKMKGLVVFVSLLFSLSVLTNYLFVYKAINVDFLGGPPTVFFWLPFRIYEFAMGAFLVSLMRWKMPNGFISSLMLIIGLILICYAALKFNDNLVYPYYYGFVPAIGAFLVIYSCKSPLTQAFLGNGVSRYLGNISYSLYLVHWPVIVFYRYYIYDDISLMQSIIVLAITAILSVALFEGVEQKYRYAWQAKGNVYSVNRVRFLGAIGVMSLAVALYAGYSQGWQGRVASVNSNVDAFLADGQIEGDFHLNFHGGGTCKNICPEGPQPPKVLMVGDSHARHYHTGLLKNISTSENGLLTIDKGSCLFSEEKCDEFEEVFDKGLHDLPAETVLISQRWDYYKHVTRHFPGQHPRDISVEDLARLYVQKIVDRFKNAHSLKRLVIIGAVPQIAAIDGLVSCFTRPDYISEPDPMACSSVEIKNYKPILYRQAFNQVFKQVLLEQKIGSTELSFWDPFEALCQDNSCKQVDKGFMLYSDDDHLSVFGSKVVIDYFFNKDPF